MIGKTSGLFRSWGCRECSLIAEADVSVLGHVGSARQLVWRDTPEPALRAPTDAIVRHRRLPHCGPLLEARARIAGVVGGGAKSIGMFHWAGHSEAQVARE